MDLVTIVTACALAVDPKVMHALVWRQSGGEPWAVSVPGEPNPRVYPNMNDAIKEIRAISPRVAVRVGLAGVVVQPSRVSASVLLPCRNVAMAADQIGKHTSRCKTHPRLKADPAFCALAVYRGSWDHPDVKFATDVTTTVTRGDAPNFDMPPGTSTNIFDIADDVPSDNAAPVVDITAAFAEQARGWSSALFPTKPQSPVEHSERSVVPTSPTTEPATPASTAPSPTNRNPRDRELFVRRIVTERP